MAVKFDVFYFSFINNFLFYHKESVYKCFQGHFVIYILQSKLNKMIILTIFINFKDNKQYYLLYNLILCNLKELLEI